MEPSSSTPQRARLHPLVATAAISVIVLSAVGITALVMNRSSATSSPYDVPAPTVAADQTRPVAPQALVATEPPAPEPAQRVAVAPATNTPAAPSYSPPPPVAQAPGPFAPKYGSNDAPAPVTAAAPVCRHCGVVDSIREIKVKGEGTGVGAVGGAVVGGLLGNMVGAGRGKALATVAGAVGGGLGGNAIEKNVRSTVEHRMVVRLDDGKTRTFTQSAPFGYSVGERVRVVNGHVQRG